MHFKPEDREAMNEMAYRRKPLSISLLRAFLVYLDYLERGVERLTEQYNESVREGWKEREFPLVAETPLLRPGVASGFPPRV